MTSWNKIYWTEICQCYVTYHMTILLSLYSNVKTSPNIYNMLLPKYPALRKANCLIIPHLQCLLEWRKPLGSEGFSSPCWSATCPCSFPWFGSCLQNTVSGRTLDPHLQIWPAHLCLVKDQSMPLQRETAKVSIRGKTFPSSVKQTPVKKSGGDCISNYLFLSNLIEKPKATLQLTYRTTPLGPSAGWTLAETGAVTCGWHATGGKAMAFVLMTSLQSCSLLG